MNENNVKYAVVFTYSFEESCVVNVFETEEEAKSFMKKSFFDECFIEKDENGTNVTSEITSDGMYAKMVVHGKIEDTTTEFFVSEIENIK